MNRENLQLQRAAQSERLTDEIFSLVVSSIKDYAIFALNQDGIILTWNEGAEKINGYKAREIIGKHFSLFYPQDVRDAKHPERELEIAKERGRYEEEGWRIRKDGSRFWANVVITALFSSEGKHLGFAKVTRDLTERKRFEEEREALASAIRRTNEELQRLVYVVSHELQPPTATISRYCNLFLVRYRDRLGNDAKEFLQKIEHSSRLIARMVDDLWSYARVTKTDVIYESVSLAQLLQDVQDQMHAELSGINVTYSGMPDVIGNRDQLRHVFKELLRNAARNRRGDKPKIELSAELRNGQAHISIKDNGRGIDRVFLCDVFRLFYRLDGGLEPDATGMGLPVCRKIIEQHGGNITIESQPGFGTAVHVTLPLVEDSIYRSSSGPESARRLLWLPR